MGPGHNAETVRCACGCGTASQPLRDELGATSSTPTPHPVPGWRGDEFYYGFWRDAAHPRGLWRRTTLEEYRARARLGRPARRRRAGRRRGRELGLGWGGGAQARATGVAWSACPGAAPTRWWSASTTWTRRAFVADGFTLAEAKSDVELDRRRPDLRRHRPRSRLADHLRLPAGGQAVAPGHPAGRGRHSCTRDRPDDVSAYASHDPTPGFERDFVGRSLDFYRTELPADPRRRPGADPGARRRRPTCTGSGCWSGRAAPWEVAGVTPSGRGPAGRPVRRLSRRGPRPDRAVRARRAHLAELPRLDPEPPDPGHAGRRAPAAGGADPRGRTAGVTCRAGGRVVRSPVAGDRPVRRWSDTDPDDSDEYIARLHRLTCSPRRCCCGRIGGAVEIAQAGAGVLRRHRPRPCASSSPPPPTAPGALLRGRRPRRRRRRADPAHRVRRVRDLADAAATAACRPGLACPGRHLRGGQPPRRRRVRARSGTRRRCGRTATGRTRTSPPSPRDLVARGITTPRAARHRGRQQRRAADGGDADPLPGAVRRGGRQVPLLDMRRYHQLLAGASWMAEYGDPDDPADWAYTAEYSPYHNVRPGAVTRRCCSSPRPATTGCTPGTPARWPPAGGRATTCVLREHRGRARRGRRQRAAGVQVGPGVGVPPTKLAATQPPWPGTVPRVDRLGPWSSWRPRPRSGRSRVSRGGDPSRERPCQRTKSAPRSGETTVRTRRPNSCSDTPRGRAGEDPGPTHVAGTFARVRDGQFVQPRAHPAVHSVGAVMGPSGPRLSGGPCPSRRSLLDAERVDSGRIVHGPNPPPLSSTDRRSRVWSG